MSKPVTSFIRQQLKVKGRTEHTGRGGFWCDGDLTIAELNKRLEAKLPDWQAAGHIEKVERTSDAVSITFNKATFDKYYRIAVFPTTGGRMYAFAVYMTIQ